MESLKPDKDNSIPGKLILYFNWKIYNKGGVCNL